MTEHSLPQWGEILRLGELCEERQFSFFLLRQTESFRCLSGLQEAVRRSGIRFRCIPVHFFSLFKHNMKKRPVDAGLCYLFCLEEFAELFIIEKIIQLSADSVCQLQ